MRRVVDEDLQRRLEEAIPTKSQKSNTAGETPKSQKKGARKPAAEKKGGRKKKKQATNLFEQYDQKSDSGMGSMKFFSFPFFIIYATLVFMEEGAR